MKFIAVLTRKAEFEAEAFQPHLPAEVKRAKQLYMEGSFREIYSRSDGKGAILVIEAADQSEAEGFIQSLPLVEKQMLDYEIYGADPYRGFHPGA